MKTRELIPMALAVVLLSIVSLAAQSYEFDWAKGAGGSNFDYGRAVSTDASGNCYVTGRFQQTASFGSISLTSSGSSDIFVAKLDSNGNWLWVKQAGGTSGDEGMAIATDTSGNCYVTGHFQGTATFGSISLTSSGSWDIFTAKLDPAGNWLWATQAGGSGDDEGGAIAIDASGNSYVTGFFDFTATFGSTSLTSSGYGDIFIGKLDSGGNWLWAKRAGGSDDDEGTAIATDPSGNCLVTGIFKNTSSFGSASLTSSGADDIFIAKLDSGGNWLWAERAGAADEDRAMGIASDPGGNCYVTGFFAGSVNFGATTLASDGEWDLFVAKLDGDANWLWATRAGGFGNDYGWGIATGAAGACYVTGFFSSTAAFGSSSLTSNGQADIVVAQLDSGGDWLWATRAGGPTNDYGYGIAIDGAGNCYVTGIFIGTATFGSTSLTSEGSADIFVTKLSQQVNATEGINPPVPVLTAYPNPFYSDSLTRIEAFVNKGESGTLVIYNLAGQVLRKYELHSGLNIHSWDGRDANGVLCASGVYFYKVSSPSLNQSRKLVLIK